MDQRQQQMQRMTLKDRFLWLLLESDREPIEVFLAIIMLSWSVLFLLPYSLFGISVQYDVMRHLADESTWGVITGSVFALHALSSLFNWPRGRVIGLFGMFVWYTFAGLMFVYANHGGVSMAVCWNLAAASATVWALLRFVVRHRW